MFLHGHDTKGKRSRLMLGNLENFGLAEAVDKHLDGDSSKEHSHKPLAGKQASFTDNAA